MLAEGRPADVVVFDAKTVGPGPLKRISPTRPREEHAEILDFEHRGADVAIGNAISGQQHNARSFGQARLDRAGLCCGRWTAP